MPDGRTKTNTHPPRNLTPAWFTQNFDAEMGPVLARTTKMPSNEYNALIDKFVALSQGKLTGRSIPGTTLYEITQPTKGTPYWAIYSIDEAFNYAVILQIGGGNISKNKNLDIEIAKKHQLEHPKVMAKLIRDLQDEDYVAAKIEKDILFKSNEKLSFTLHVLFCMAGQIPNDLELEKNSKRIREWALNPRQELSAEEEVALNAWLEPTGIDIDRMPCTEAKDSVLTAQGIAFMREALMACENN